VRLKFTKISPQEIYSGVVRKWKNKKERTYIQIELLQIISPRLLGMTDNGDPDSIQELRFTPRSLLTI
jgi:hypothetical protein